MLEAKTYLVGVCSSETNGIIMNRVQGTEDRVKQHLVNLVRANIDNRSEDFESGSTTVNDITVEDNGTLQGYANFHDFHMDFTATPEQPPETLPFTENEALELAEGIVSCIDHITTSENPRGFGYFLLTEHTFNNDETENEDLTLQLAVDVCKYKDPNDDHLYYGVFYVPEVDGGDNLDQSDWMYTDHCTAKELADVFMELERIFTADYLWKLYKESI